jgi:hypothetical protein
MFCNVDMFFFILRCNVNMTIFFLFIYLMQKQTYPTIHIGFNMCNLFIRHRTVTRPSCMYLILCLFPTEIEYLEKAASLCALLSLSGSRSLKVLYNFHFTVIDFLLTL